MENLRPLARLVPFVAVHTIFLTRGGYVFGCVCITHDGCATDCVCHQGGCVLGLYVSPR